MFVVRRNQLVDGLEAGQPVYSGYSENEEMLSSSSRPGDLFRTRAIDEVQFEPLTTSDYAKTVTWLYYYPLKQQKSRKKRRYWANYQPIYSVIRP